MGNDGPDPRLAPLGRHLASSRSQRRTLAARRAIQTVFADASQWQKMPRPRLAHSFRGDLSNSDSTPVRERQIGTGDASRLAALLLRGKVRARQSDGDVPRTPPVGAGPVLGVSVDRRGGRAGIERL